MQKYTTKWVFKKSTKLFWSTIVMILLIVISISTATFAWFSANSKVGSGSITFEARNTADASIFLAWNKNNPMNTISFANPSEIAPMVPRFSPIIDETKFENPLVPVNNFAENFYTASINPETKKFNTNGINTEPYVAKNSENNQNFFYVLNGSNETTTVNMQITNTDGDTIQFLRIAVFLNGIYKGTIVDGSTVGSAFSNTHAGIIYEDTQSDNFPSFNSNSNLQFTLAGNTSEVPNEYSQGSIVTVQLVCWYDGVYLNDEHSAKSATMALTLYAQKTSGP